MNKIIFHVHGISSLTALFSLTVLIIIGCSTSAERVSADEINADSRADKKSLEWFSDAKFGMFIHWGPYSELAGEWNNKQVPVGKNAEWIMKLLQIPVKEYRELAHKMNPSGFNADEWVSLAKNTGMKYIVLTAKHHDGFAMYHSGVNDYNIVDWTPFKRDPLKELATACAREGIKLGVYYSHREDWDHPGGYGNNWDYDNDWGEDLYNHEKFSDYLEGKAKPQLRELLTNYGPIALVWFDRGLYTPQQGKDFVNLVRSVQPGCLVNGRVGHYNQELLGDYQNMSDNGMPPGGLDEYWETPQTLNKTWGFSKFDTEWKTSEEIIRRFVEIVSRGGNYLLNIGPTGLGEVPGESVKILNKAGVWINSNSEAIYGTTANPFRDLPWGYCTVKGNRLYLFVRDWPDNGNLVLSGMRNAVSSSWFLKDKTIKVPFSQTDDKLQISLPSRPVDDPLTVIVLETELPLLIDPPKVLQDDSGKAELNYLTATTYGKTMTRFNRKGQFHISRWTGPEDYAEWLIHIDKPGKFKAVVKYAANRDSEGKKYEISLQSEQFEGSTVYTGDWFDYREFPAGYFNIDKPGDYELTIRPKTEDDKFLMHLQSITLFTVNTIREEGWGIN